MYVFVFLLMAFLMIHPVMGEPVAAISKYGTPKYNPTQDQEFSYRKKDAPKGGNVRIGIVGSFDSLNPFSVKGVCAAGMEYTYGSLMRRAADEPFTLYSNIAETMDVADDFSRVTFKLNPKATFNDGSPVTAEDVKFTMELLRDKGLPRYKNHFGPKKLKNIHVEDVHTVTFEWFPDEQGQFDKELNFIAAMVPVLSKAQLNSVELISFTQTPLLTAGPYRVKTVEYGKRIIYERVTPFWGADLMVNKGAFNFDTVEVIYVKNASVHFQEFLTNNIDIYFEQDPNSWKTNYNVPGVKEGRIKLLEMNHARPVPVRTIAFNMRREKFHDWKVRRALDLALDFETLNHMVFFDTLKRAKSLFENTPLAHTGAASGKERALLTPHQELIDNHIQKGMLPKNVLDVPYTPSMTKGDGDQRENLDRADKLLTEGGWRIQKGKRMNAKGEHLSFEFLIKDPRLEKIALAYKRSLHRLGIDLNVRYVDNVQYEDRTSNRDFDMILHTWSNSLCPGAEQGYYFGTAAADANGSSNYIGVKDVLLEALAKDINRAKSYEDLTAAVHNLDRFALHSHIMIPFAFENTAYVAYDSMRIALPPIDPKVGVSIVECGYAAGDDSVSTDILGSFMTWCKSLLFKDPSS